MKDKIHPKYVVTKVTCGCGNTFTTRSTQAGVEGRYLQRLPPVLYRQAEVRRHGGPDREVPEEVRRHRLRQPQPRQEGGRSRRRRRGVVLSRTGSGSPHGAVHRQDVPASASLRCAWRCVGDRYGLRIAQSLLLPCPIRSTKNSAASRSWSGNSSIPRCWPIRRG